MKEIMKRLIGFVTVLALVSLVAAFGIEAATLLFVAEDPVGDDYGPGTYVYPTHEVFAVPGAFDIEHVSILVDEFDLIVRVRIAGELLNPWGAPHGFSIQMIDFYLDTAPGGSTATIFDTTIPENVELNPEGTINAVIAEDSAWEFAFRIQGWEGSMFTPFIPNGGLITPFLNVPLYQKTEFVAIVSIEPAIRTIVFTIPLDVIGEPTPEWRFVLYMAGVERGNARLVTEEGGDWFFGGGADDDSDSNIIDLLVGPDQTQEEILDYTVVSPVVLPGILLILESEG